MPGLKGHGMFEIVCILDTLDHRAGRDDILAQHKLLTQGDERNSMFLFREEKCKKSKISA